MAVQNLEDLTKKVRLYNPAADIELLNRAYFYACEAHGIQTRKEGTPFMAHPLAVASILADMKMDVVTLASAILHDTIEDTPTTPDDIKKRFGYELGFLVDSLTKLSQVEFKSKEIAQAENFRRMLLSMAEDIRVIIIKFADRLHNMRTLEYLPENKQMRIAQETLDIYAPLAHRLGIGWIKTEFEDLSFKYLMPKLHADIAKKVKKKNSEQKGYVKNLIKSLEKRLKEEGLPGDIEGRVKHYYGIYQKVSVRGVPFDQIHDVLGIRIITDTKANCYAILGLIHSLWKPIPGKFKDYIGVPKSNMYQSLHTTVVGPDGERVEFQIRSEEMHVVAEGGIASHWRYKEKGKGKSRELDDRYVAWLRELVQAQKEEPDAREFLAALKAEVVPDVIYVFTPEGDIKEMPAGSTTVDFAYSIHTEVGHRCMGARLNGRMVPLRQPLESGSTVEIITSQSHKPSRDWLKFVVTQRAKARIKQWLKTEEREQSIALGTKLLETELRKKNLSPSLLKSDQMEEVAKSYTLQSIDDLLVAVGYGKVSQHQAINRLTPGEHPPEKQKPVKQLKEHTGITIEGVDNVLYHTAKCCFPVPGDSLDGFITRGKGVTVHRSDCQSLQRLATDEARLVDVDWVPQHDSKAYARLLVGTVDRPGIMAKLTATISGAEINISRLEVATTPERTARIVFVLEVRDKAQLQRLMNKIVQTEGVLNVTRY